MTITITAFESSPDEPALQGGRPGGRAADYVAAPFLIMEWEKA
jgi:hypothetical protein